MIYIIIFAGIGALCLSGLVIVATALINAAIDSMDEL